MLTFILTRNPPSNRPTTPGVRRGESRCGDDAGTWQALKAKIREGVSKFSDLRAQGRCIGLLSETDYGSSIIDQALPQD